MLIANMVFALASWGGQTHKVKSIRQIDFKNFTYAWSEPEPPEDEDVPWHWFNSPTDSHFRAVHGLHHFYSAKQEPYEREHAPLISVDSVVYGDLDGDGNEEAVVAMNYSTGGTFNWDYLYVFTLDSGRAKLIERMETGSGGSGGLVRMSVQHQFLVIDFADPEQIAGDCCSKGFIRVHYRLQEGEFIEDGERGRGKLDLIEGPPRPRFSDYPVKGIYTGKPAPALITKQFQMFHTRIRRGAKSKVEFAGHYTIPRWECGTDCNMFVIVDSKTGQVFNGGGIVELPFKWIQDYGEESMMRMEFYPDSRLLKINACPNEKDCGLYDYVIVEGKRLKLIRMELLPKEYQFPQTP